MLNIISHKRNANQNKKEIASHICQNGHLSRGPQITNVGEDVEKRHTVGGNVNWYRCNGKQHGDFSKTKNRTSTSSSNSSPGYISRENKYINYLMKTLIDSKGYIHPSIHSSTIYNSQDMEAT